MATTSEHNLMLEAKEVFNKVIEMKKNKKSNTAIITNIQQNYQNFFYSFDFIVSHMESLEYFNPKVFKLWLKEIEYNPYNKNIEDRVNKQVKYCVLAFCDMYNLKKTSNKTKKYKLDLKKELLHNAEKQKKLIAKIVSIKHEAELEEKKRLIRKIYENI